MRQGDLQKGFPYCDYQGLLADIEALTGLIGGESAFATDNPDAPFGKFDGIDWHWSLNEPGGETSSTEIDADITNKIYSMRAKTASLKVFKRISFS